MQNFISDNGSIPNISFADIESERRRTFFRPNFPQTIEKIYRGYNIEDKHRSTAMIWLIGVMLYDSFLLSDYF